MGFKNIFLIPDERHSWTKKEKELLKNEIDKIYLKEGSISWKQRKIY